MKLVPGILIAALLIVITMTSCRRDYICQCEISYSGQPGLPDTLVREYPITDTKDKAAKLCSDNSSETTQNGIRTVENCGLY